MPSTSLSAITETTPTRYRKSNSVGQRLRQGRGARRIVGGIDEYRWGAAHPLQPAGARRVREALPHGVDVELTVRARPEEGLDRGERDQRVVGLMFAVQRQEDLGVDAAESLQFEQLTPDGDLAAQHRELRVLPGHRGVGSECFCENDFHRLGRLLSDDGDRAEVGLGGDRILGVPLDDAGLLRGDLGDGVAEVVGVVDADRRDDRDGCVDDVGGVPPAAEADLDDGDVDRRVGERGERHGGDDLELAHPRAACRLGLRVDELDERLDLAVGVDVLGWRDRRAVDGDALDGRLQVRAGGPSRCGGAARSAASR